jgi:PAS domain S-box-containing protein
MGGGYEVFDSLSDFVLVIDRDFRIVFVNKALLDLCGLSAGDILNKRCHEISHSCPMPCTMQGLVCPHREVFASGKGIRTLHTHKCGEGKERIFEIAASPLYDKGGHAALMVEVMRDVTESETLKQSLIKKERELEESRDFVSSILEGIGEGVVVVDRDFKIISANKGYCRQVNMSCDDIIGHHCYEVSHHSDRPCYEMGESCPVKLTFSDGISHSARHTHLNKEKTAHHTEISSYPIKDFKGGVTAVIEMIEDITEKVAREEARRQAEEEIKRKVKELEEFYSMAVDRELKMQELKNEIENLKKKLKESG